MKIQDLIEKPQPKPQPQPQLIVQPQPQFLVQPQPQFLVQPRSQPHQPQPQLIVQPEPKPQSQLIVQPEPPVSKEEENLEFLDEYQNDIINYVKEKSEKYKVRGIDWERLIRDKIFGWEMEIVGFREFVATNAETVISNMSNDSYLEGYSREKHNICINKIINYYERLVSNLLLPNEKMELESLKIFLIEQRNILINYRNYPIPQDKKFFAQFGYYKFPNYSYDIPYIAQVHLIETDNMIKALNNKSLIEDLGLESASLSTIDSSGPLSISEIKEVIKELIGNLW